MKTKKDIIALIYQLYPHFDTLEGFQQYDIWQEVLCIEYYEGREITRQQWLNWKYPFKK